MRSDYTMIIMLKRSLKIHGLQANDKNCLKPHKRADLDRVPIYQPMRGHHAACGSLI